MKQVNGPKSSSTTSVVFSELFKTRVAYPFCFSVLPQPEINISLPSFNTVNSRVATEFIEFAKNFKSRHWLVFAVKANKLAGLDPRAPCFLLTSPSVLIQAAFLMIQCDFYCCSISPQFLLYGPQQYTSKIRITTVLLLYRDLLT